MTVSRKARPSAEASIRPPVPVRGSEFNNSVLICILLAVVTLVVFSPATRHDFVNYDDPDYVSANRQVQGSLTFANIKWAFDIKGHASNWHPLTWLSHMLDWQLFGQQPGMFHFVSLLFHAANAVLLFLILTRLTGAHWRSAFVAALFALHPLHVESVAWISERKDVLSTLFFLLTLMAYAAYVARVAARSPETKSQIPTSTTQKRSKSQAPTSRGEEAIAELAEFQISTFKFQGSKFSPWIFYIAALLCFVLGLMAKPMLVTVPFLLLLLDFWPLQRITIPPSPSRSNNPAAELPDPLRLALEKVPFFLLTAGSCAATYFAQKAGGAVSTTISLGARMDNALVSYARYLGKLFWPVNLSVLYPHPGHWPAWAVVASGSLVLAIFVVVAWLARRVPYLAMGWLWFFGAMVPVIGLVQVGIQSMADRYTYIPAVGIFIIIAWGLTDLVLSRPGGSTALAVGGVASLLACALLTFRQVGYWHDSETLFQHAVEVTPDNYLAYNNLGHYLDRKGRTTEAMRNYQKSLSIKRDYEDALNNVGYILAGQHKPAEAIPYYEAALRVRPDQVEVHNNLGNALWEVGRVNEAISHFEFVLQHAPDHVNAHNGLGIALANLGKLDQAMVHFREAIRTDPKSASAHGNLGNALAAQHQLDEAISEYTVSLGLSPEDSQTHNNLANVLFEQGRLDQALEHYNRALSLDPRNAEAHFNSALALARQGNREGALKHFQEALRLKPDYAEARRQIDLLLGTK
jgi:tetratricopeptide (TPR) repeat protein